MLVILVSQLLDNDVLQPILNPLSANPQNSQSHSNNYNQRKVVMISKQNLI